MRKNAKSVSVCAAAAATAVSAMLASNLSAAEIHWMGGAGDILATNYAKDGVVGAVPPASGDILDLGANGTVTTTGTGVPGRVRVGHNFTSFVDDALPPVPTNPSIYAGPATLTMSTGTLSLGGNGTSGTYAGIRAGLVVGYNADGTFNLEGGTVNVTENVVIGADDSGDTFTGAGTGTLNISGGTFRVRRNDLLIGHGNPGVVTISSGGNLNVLSQTLTHNDNIDMYVGFTTASTLTKTGAGDLKVNNNFLIGSGSTVTLSAGTTTTKAKTVLAGYPSDAPAGNIFVGRSGSNGDILNIDGTAVVNIGHRFLLSSAGGATNATVNHSAGTVNVVRNLAVSDSGNTSSGTYNLSGTASLTANLDLSRVGRRGTGMMFQTGGTATFNVGLAVGDDESTAGGETDDATGFYEISAGTLTTNIASGNSLRVGSAGNGTFTVIGDDGVIDVNGGFIVNNTADGVGNLVYRFEAGELLSVIDVSGTATFASGTGLNVDTSIAAPTQRSYDVLTAANVVDNGAVDSAGWTHRVINGGANGKLLQIAQTGTFYWDIDGANPGAGGATPNGTWDSGTTNLSADSTGSSATTPLSTAFGDDVVFGAGTDATGIYTVTVSGTQQAKSVSIAYGDVTLAGGTIDTPVFDVDSDAFAAISSDITNSAGDSITKTGPGPLLLAAANEFTGGVNVQGGTLTLSEGIKGNGPLTIADGATAVVPEGSPNTYNPPSDVPSGDNAKGSKVSSLTIAPTGTLDLGNSDMAVDYVDPNSPLDTVRDLITSGYNGGGWDGPGIKSFTVDVVNNGAALDPAIFGLGYAENALLPAPYGNLESQGGPLFSDQDVDLSTVLIKFTWVGDLNLDGLVDFQDLSVFNTNYDNGASSGRYWFEGDFNYDGFIDFQDLSLFNTNYDPSKPSLPEPSSLAALAGLSFVLGRRRCRARA